MKRFSKNLWKVVCGLVVSGSMLFAANSCSLSESDLNGISNSFMQGFDVGYNHPEQTTSYLQSLGL